MPSPDPNTPGPAGAGTEPPRLPSFARRLRDNLPASPLDYLIYLAFAAVLHLVLHLTLPAAAATTVVTAAGGAVVFATAGYLAARFRPPAAPPDEADDDPVSGDG